MTVSISKEDKRQAVEKHGSSAADTGASASQIAILTLRINDLQRHFQSHPKDKHSRRGLIGLVNRRRRLLDYLRRTDEAGYKNLIAELKIRR